MKTIAILAVVICGLILLGYAGFSLRGRIVSKADKPSPVAPPTTSADVDQTPYRQSEFKRLEPDQEARDKTLHDLMADGTLGTLTIENSTGYLTVGPGFTNGSYDRKRVISDLAYMWCRCKQLKEGGDCEALIIQDAANKKEIGKDWKYGFTIN